MVLRGRIKAGLDVKPKELFMALRRLKGSTAAVKEQQVRLLKKAIFSRDRGIRKVVAKGLIDRGQFSFLLGVARRVDKEQFPPDFFKEDSRFGDFPLKPRLSERQERDIRQNLVKALEKGPAFKYKGFDVYEMERLIVGGMLYHGSIFVEKSDSKKVKRIKCAHEVGEIFHHIIGIGMELVEAKEQGAEREYLKSLEMDGIERIREASRVAETMPEMKAIAKELMEMRRRLGPSGP